MFTGSLLHTSHCLGKVVYLQQIILGAFPLDQQVSLLCCIYSNLATSAE